MGRKYQVTVATSDGLEQVIILGAGAKRMSARELYREVKQTEQEIRQDYIRPDTGSKSLLIHQASQEVAEWMENKRLGK
jgi:predicted RNA-binding protein with PIN domain